MAGFSWALQPVGIGCGVELEFEGESGRGRLAGMRKVQPIARATPWAGRGWRRLHAIGTAIVLAVGVHRGEAGMEDVLKAAAEREAVGDFSGAEAILGESVEILSFRERMAWEQERLRRIRRDYPLTRRELVAALNRAVRDFREEELAGWVREGALDRMTIDGEERFFVSSVSNLFFRRPELRARRVPGRDTSAMQRAHLGNARAIREAARKEGTPYVLPKRFEVRMVVRLLPGGVEPGAPVQAWLPVPRRFPHQGGFELVGSVPSAARVAPEESPIRSVFLERPAGADGSADFEIHYRYTAHGVWFDLGSGKAPVGEAAGGSPERSRHLEPGPHVEFTESMRRLADEVGAGEVRPAERARRYYEWIADRIRYSYAPEYSTVRNLGELCRASGRGDCGQAVFLMMTLCRISGIPARWQSGWSIFPGDETIHDWCEVHLEPWGWVPVDPYMGMYAMQYAPELSLSERVELRDFHFGGLSQFRMGANSDHGQALWPRKRSMRSDDVDFQRGELEAAGRNLFFDRFRYELTWEEVSRP